MTVEFPWGDVSNDTWYELQRRVSMREDADNYPAVLLYPHGDILVEEVVDELEQLGLVRELLPN